MATIYRIMGGGQQVRQDKQYRAKTRITEVVDSVYPERAGCNGQDFYTGCMWSTSLKTLKRWARGWAGGKRVSFIHSSQLHDLG